VIGLCCIKRGSEAVLVKVRRNTKMTGCADIIAPFIYFLVQMSQSFLAERIQEVGGMGRAVFDRE